MQSQLMCSGCRTVLLYPRGATNVCCVVCNTVTSVPPAGLEMAQLVCGCCRSLSMYSRGATSVRCFCCNTINIARETNQVAHINCGQCRTTLMYPYGAPSVKCAICHFVINIRIDNMSMPVPVHMPNGPTPLPPTTAPPPHTAIQTVIIENPMSVNESGKLVSNVVVGVTTKKK